MRGREVTKVVRSQIFKSFQYQAGAFTQASKNLSRRVTFLNTHFLKRLFGRLCVGWTTGRGCRQRDY